MKSNRLFILCALVLFACPDNGGDNGEPPPPPPPTVKILDFTASPRITTFEAGTTLSWKVENAETVLISPGAFRTDALEGQAMFFPEETTTYTLTAASGEVVRTRMRTVTVNAPDDPTLVAPWDEWKTDLFGRHGVPDESELHLGQVENQHALKTLDDILLWDGTRNPSGALECGGWQEYNGFTRDEVREAIGENRESLALLRLYFKHRLCRECEFRWMPTGGLLIHSVAPRDDWERDLPLILGDAVQAGRMNGICGACPDGCVRLLEIQEVLR